MALRLGLDIQSIQSTLMYYDILCSMTDDEREAGCCVRNVSTASIEVGELLDHVGF